MVLPKPAIRRLAFGFAQPTSVAGDILWGALDLWPRGISLVSSEEISVGICEWVGIHVGADFGLFRRAGFSSTPT